MLRVVGSEHRALFVAVAVVALAATLIGCDKSGSTIERVDNLPRLTLECIGTGSGTITANPPSSTGYEIGTVVTLTANAASGSTFTGWSGDASGTQNPLTITVNGNMTIRATFYTPPTDPPIADFDYSGGISVSPPPSGWPNGVHRLTAAGSITVSFTDTSTRGPESWSWSFGDGGSSSQQNPSHTYTSGGIYSVTLTASNSKGNDSETKSDIIIVTDNQLGSPYWYASHTLSGAYKTHDTTEQSWADQVLSLTNTERANAGLGPLSWDADAQEAAKVHAEDLCGRWYFQDPDPHSTPEGWSVLDRLNMTGVSGTLYGCGENIAAGQSSPSAVVTAWMNSPGHRANILNTSYTHLGVGVVIDNTSYYGYYWCQVFLVRP